MSASGAPVAAAATGWVAVRGPRVRTPLAGFARKVHSLLNRKFAGTATITPMKLPQYTRVRRPVESLKISAGSAMGDSGFTKAVATASVMSRPKTPTAMNCGSCFHHAFFGTPEKV